MDGDRSKRVLWMAGLVVLGFLLRTTNAAEVFVGGAVVFPGNDPYYQAHRVFQTLAAYPWVPMFDPLLDYPHGAAPIWPPLFPWGLATIAKLLGLSAADPRGVETFLALSVPVMGALICVPVYALARRILDEAGAWMAAALSVLVPAHLWYSRLGFVDHHAAVTLVQVCMFLAALVVAQGGRGVALLVTITLGMLLWNGYVLFVGILDAYLFGLILLGPEAERRRLARAVAWTHGAAALAILPWAAATVRATGAPWGTFALSWLHPTVLAVVAAMALGIAVFPRSAPWWICAVGAAAVGAACFAGVWGDVVGWVFARDDFMSSIQEAVPIFLHSDGSLDLQGPTIWLTRFWLVAPVLLVLLARRARRRSNADGADASSLLLVVWGTGLFLLALRQRRFAETFAPALAVAVAWGLQGLRAWSREVLVARGWRTLPAALVAAGVTILAILVGIGPYYGPIVRSPGGLLAIAQARAERPASREVPPLHRALRRLAEIAASTDDAGDRGVMNLWPLGHHILYLTKLPVVAGPFGSHLGGTSFEDATDFFLETDEERGARLLESRHVRYVVVDADLGTIGAAIRAREGRTTRYYRKTPLADGGVRIDYLPALRETLYFRLVQPSSLRRFRLLVDAARDDRPGNPKIFERVAGARLRLHGRPAADYVLRYAFRSTAGRDREFLATVHTGPDGFGETTLPYSSERPDLAQTSAWQVRGPGFAGDLVVSETAVASGETIAVDLAPVAENRF